MAPLGYNQDLENGVAHVSAGIFKIRAAHGNDVAVTSIQTVINVLNDLARDIEKGIYDKPPVDVESN